jgi:hypothetical protein
MTSLAFMFDDVPAPPWITSTTNCSLSSPFITSVQACSMAAARSASNSPSSRLVRAAASFTAARPRTRCMLLESGCPVMGKFSTARSVWTPQ